VNQAGQVRAAVIDFGGFLGVGSRKIAIDWNALHFASNGRPDRITLELTRNQVRLAPEYKPGEPVVVLGTAEASQPTGGTPAPRNGTQRGRGGFHSINVIAKTRHEQRRRGPQACPQRAGAPRAGPARSPGRAVGR